MASIFARLTAQSERAGIVPRTTISRKWFIQRVKSLSGLTPRRMLQDDKAVYRRKPLIGRMFMFVYDPKHKKKLPFYDTFPLILMVGPAENGFYGLNLHYLNPRMRAAFFDKLMEFANNKRFNEKTRLRLSYELLKNASNLDAFKPCFKHYLWDHVRTHTMEIQAPEWEAALFLPTENFVNASNSKVWRNSKTLI